MFGKDLEIGICAVCLLLVFVGGVNWLITGIRSMEQGNIEVEDGFNLIPGFPPEVSNILYFVVFAATLVITWCYGKQLLKGK